MSEIRFTVPAAKTAAGALDLLQQSVMAMSAAHGNTLRLMLLAHDVGDDARKRTYSEEAAKLVDAMGKLAQVEMFLYNESLPKAPERG